MHRHALASRAGARPCLTNAPLASLAALASLALLLAAAALLASPGAARAQDPPHPPSCIGTPGPLPGTVLDLPEADTTDAHAAVIARGRATYRWGPATWLEPAFNCQTVGQTFDFWPAGGSTGGDPKAQHPTLVYFHPNEASSHVTVDSPFWRNVISPAVAAGYNVASVEFRHPVIDQYLAPQLGGQVPHLDTGYAIQYLRAHARTLGIDPDDVFAFGYSRGSLALWQALQPDLGGPGTGRPSSRVSAFLGYQSQTTYQCVQYAQLFLDPQDPGTATMTNDCLAENWYESQFGSALDAVRIDSVPVRLQYQQGFELVKGSAVQIRRVTADYLQANYEPEHYPDFAIALFDAYVAAGNTSMPYPQANVPYEDQFKGWQDFVRPLLRQKPRREPPRWP